ADPQNRGVDSARPRGTAGPARIADAPSPSSDDRFADDRRAPFTLPGRQGFGGYMPAGSGWLGQMRSTASSRLAGGGLAERGLRGGEPRDRHPERRARDIVEPDLVAEGDRGGISRVLAADAELEVVFGV